MLAPGTAGNGPAFSAKPTSAGQTISINTNTKITMNSEVYDTNNCYDTSNSRFTPNVAGYYQIHGHIRTGSTAATSQTEAAIYKNGSIFQSSNIPTTGANDSGTPVSAFVYMNGTTDYLEVYYQYNTGNSSITVSTDPNLGGIGTATWWYGYLARAA